MNKLAAFALALMPAIVAAAEPAAGKAPLTSLASPEVSSANAGIPRVVQERQVRHVHPLGRIQRPRAGRMGHGE